MDDNLLAFNYLLELELDLLPLGKKGNIRERFLAYLIDKED